MHNDVDMKNARIKNIGSAQLRGTATNDDRTPSKHAVGVSVPVQVNGLVLKGGLVRGDESYGVLAHDDSTLPVRVIVRKSGKQILNADPNACRGGSLEIGDTVVEFI